MRFRNRFLGVPLAVLLMGLMGLTGCPASSGDPFLTTAYQTIGGVETTVDLAMNAWGQYVAQQYALYPDPTSPQRLSLANQIQQSQIFYGEYQSTISTVHTLISSYMVVQAAGASGATGPSGASGTTGVIGVTVSSVTVDEITAALSQLGTVANSVMALVASFSNKPALHWKGAANELRRDPVFFRYFATQAAESLVMAEQRITPSGTSRQSVRVGGGS